ncbi:hypothetical protein JCM10207_003173, partial [Rhodosporidiobolus poonsookiae]
MPPVTTIVCTLLSRGEADTPGQGSELLLFTPPSKRTRGEVYDSAKLAFVLQGTLETPARPTDVELRKAADKSVGELLLLNATKDMRWALSSLPPSNPLTRKVRLARSLVRRSRVLDWAPDTLLVAFLFRMTTSYERGFDLSYAAAHGEPPMPAATAEMAEEPRAASEQDEVDKAMYRITESRLGRSAHSWEEFKGHEHIATAYHLVVLPPPLDESLYLASAVANLSVLDVSDLALNTLLQLVRSKAGEAAFTGCWPPHVPQPTQKTVKMPEQVLKYRLMMFWRDVVGYQFCQVKSAYTPILSATFLRVLVPLIPLTLDSTTSLSSLTQSALNAIASEGARSRFAAANVERFAVAKLLERASRE